MKVLKVEKAVHGFEELKRLSARGSLRAGRRYLSTTCVQSSVEPCAFENINKINLNSFAEV